MGLDAAEFTQGLSKADREAQKFAAGQKRNQSAIDKQVAGLQKQAKMFGMSAKEAKLFELSQKGATAAQLKAADAAFRQMDAQRAAATAGRALGLAAAAIAVGLVAIVRNAINAADALAKFSQKSGVSVRELGGIGYAADLAGSNLEQVSAGIGKLNRKIAEARAGNREANNIFSALQIDPKIGNSQDILLQLADRFSEFEDSPERGALAMEVFGKSGEQLIPLLLDGSKALKENIDFFKQYGGVTEEVAAKSVVFNDTITRIELVLGSLGYAIADALLPMLQGMADGLLEAREKGSLFLDIGAGIRTFFETVLILGANVVYVFKAVGTEIGGLAAQFVALISLDFKGFSAIGDAVKEDAVRARAEIDKLERRIRGIGVSSPDDQSAAESRRLGLTGPAKPKPKRRAPVVGDTGAQSRAAAEAKRILDDQIKAIRAFAGRQKDAYDFANSYLEGSYDAGLVSQSQFFQEQKRIRDAALQDTISSLNKEIEVQRLAARKSSGPDRLGLESQVREALEKRAALVETAGRDEILITQRQQASILSLRDSYEQLRATVLELGGDTASAAKIRIDKQVSDAEKLIREIGGDAGIADQYRSRLEGVESLKSAQEEYARVVDRARISEELTTLASRAGGESEIETLKAVGRVRAQALTQLQSLTAKAQELAVTLNTDEARAYAAELALGFRQALEEVDPLLTRIKELGSEAGDGIAESLGSAITQGKNFKEVLRDIERQLLDMVTKEAFVKPFGNFLSGQINGLTTGGSGGGFFSKVFSGLFGGGGGGSGLGLAAAFPKAVGGRVIPSMPYEVGERGRELFVPDQSGTIIPNHALGGTSKTYHVIINPPSGMSRQAGNQFAAQVAQQLRVADARDN